MPWLIEPVSWLVRNKNKTQPCHLMKTGQGSVAVFAFPGSGDQDSSCSPGVIPGKGLTRAGMRPNPTGGMGLWEQLPSALVPEAGFLFCFVFQGVENSLKKAELAM